MRCTSSIISVFVLVLLPALTLAVPVFTITPTSTTLTAYRGSTEVAEFTVQNTSGEALTVTNEVTGQSGAQTTSQAIDTTTNCANDTLASNASCTLDIDVTADATGSDTVKPIICAFNGMLCSQPATPVTVTVEAASANPCRGDDPTCRVFMSQGTYLGDLSQNSGSADITSCLNDIGLDRGNCICNREAIRQGYGANNKWKAWLSTSGPDVNASANIEYTALITYERASDNVVIVPPNNLLSGRLVNVIQAGSIATAWTGTDVDGTASRFDCDDWRDATNKSTGTRGDVSRTNGAWTNSFNVLCDQANTLYCFESL